jgi:hypothetical protein
MQRTLLFFLKQKAGYFHLFSPGANGKREINLDRVSLGIYVMRYENGYIGKLVKIE